MNKKLKFLSMAAAAVVLAACGNNAATNNGGSQTADVTKSEFPTSFKNDGTAVADAVFKYGIVSASPIPGVFNFNFYSAGPDADVISYFDESLFHQDENYKLKDTGIAKMSYDKDAKTVTVTIREGVKWSDGQPLTIDDYILSFEVIGHKDYDGLRYDETFENIEGMAEYHAGTADKISGITKNNDHSVTFKLKEMVPQIEQAGNFWTYAMPKHIFKDIAVKDMPASDAVRKNPVGLGAFRVTNVLDGESVTLEANPYYWQGTPKIKGVVIDVVAPTTVADEFANGNYDYVSVPTDTATVDAFKALTNNTVLTGSWSNTINFTGFKLGKLNAETGKTEVDPNAKMADKSLRQAMGYAIDMDTFASTFYGSLRARANTFITPNFGSFRDGTIEGYKYDVEKAKKLLDDAGFKDVDGDGLRENPKGEKLTINFAFMAGGTDAETQSAYYMQSWKEIGLDVQLATGRLIEFKTFYELVQNDDPGIDVFAAAMGIGSDPTPTGLWGKTAFNYTRYSSPEHDALLAKFTSADAWNNDSLVKSYQEWQKFAVEEAFAIPTLYRMGISAFNKRVKEVVGGADSSKNTFSNLHTLELTANEPIKNK